MEMGASNEKSAASTAMMGGAGCPDPQATTSTAAAEASAKAENLEKFLIRRLSINFHQALRLSSRITSNFVRNFRLRDSQFGRFEKSPLLHSHSYAVCGYLFKPGKLPRLPSRQGHSNKTFWTDLK